MFTQKLKNSFVFGILLIVFVAGFSPLVYAGVFNPRDTSAIVGPVTVTGDLTVTGQTQTDTFLIDTSVVGNMDMGGFAITNAGAITGTHFIATSTTATSTFAFDINVAGETWLEDSLTLFAGVPTIVFDDTHQGHDKYKITVDDDKLSFGAGSPLVNIMTMDSSNGNTVGIGSTSPEAKLTVQNTGSTNSFIVEDQADDTSPFIISSTGRVGIGTVTPDFNLEVEGTDAVIMAHYAAQSRGGIQAISGDRVSFIATDNIDDLVFGYNGSTPTSAGFVERMRIDNGTGNVGIGTTTPSGRLHVVTIDAGDVEAPVDAMDLVIEDVSDVGISLLTADNKSSLIRFGAPADPTGALITWNDSTGLLRLMTTSGGAQMSFNTADGTEAIRIDSSQNIGIGTSSPFAKLTVKQDAEGVGEGIAIEKSNTGDAWEWYMNGNNVLHTAFNGSTKMVINPVGNAGIGTTSPLALLSVNSTSEDNTDLFLVASTTASVGTSNAFRIDAFGNVTIAGDLDVLGSFTQEPDQLSVYATTTQAIANGAWSPVTWEVVADADGGFVGFSVPTASSTIPTTSFYQVNVDMSVDKTGGGVHLVEVALFNNNVIVKDDSTGQDCTSERTINSTNETGFLEMQCLASLSQGDIITFKANADGANSQFDRNGTAITEGATVRMVVRRQD